MSETERRAIEVACPSCGADAGKPCMSLAVPKPERWLAPVLHPHRQRVSWFREKVLEREEDHRNEAYRLTKAIDLRRDQTVFVVKDERDVGLIYVQRRVRAVYPFLGDRVAVHFRGRVPPDLEIYPRWMTIRVSRRR